MTNPEQREKIARIIALHGLGTESGISHRAPPNTSWTKEEWEQRILECVPERVERQCYELADAIIALDPAPESAESQPYTTAPGESETGHDVTQAAYTPRPAPDVEPKPIQIIREMLRLADMGFEQSMMEPEENGNYAVYERAKRFLATLARSSGS